MRKRIKGTYNIQYTQLSDSSTAVLQFQTQCIYFNEILINYNMKHIKSMAFLYMCCFHCKKMKSHFVVNLTVGLDFPLNIS